MNQTENYSLNKPEYTDNVDIAKLNENSDIIDAKLKEHSDDLDALLTGKQDTLNAAQLAAVNSGVSITKVEQIETNKNNISTLTPVLRRSAASAGAVTYSLVSDCTITLAPREGSGLTPVYRVSAMVGQSTGGIRGIILSESDTNPDTAFIAKAEQDSAVQTKLSVSAITFNDGDTARNVYCWVKGTGSGTVRVYTILENIG